MVRDYLTRLAAPLEEGRQFPLDATAGDRGVEDCGQAFICRKRTDRGRNPATSEHWPSLRRGSAHVCRQHAVWLFACRPKALLAIQPVDTVDPGWFSGPLEQDEQPPITEAPSPGCKRPVKLPLRFSTNT
jgi:hypothetical protein